MNLHKTIAARFADVAAGEQVLVLSPAWVSMGINENPEKMHHASND